MLKQPKGLIAAALANTGERFGFYTMMAILTLFLMSKFGIDGEQAGKIYSFFYTSIYILALVGGLIADRLRNYKGTIIAGILVMTAGYAALMVPTVTSKTVVIGALMVIAFGNGLFKGNLQALVGQLYDNEQYAKLRDTGFQIFYMFINIGAMFAPFAAVGVRNWWLRTQGFLYNSDLSALCHQYIGGPGPFQRAGCRSEPRRRPGGHGRFRAELSQRLQHRIPLCVRCGYRGAGLLAGGFPGQQEEAARSQGCGRFQDDAFEGRNPAGCA